jgi:hypothetical protein
MHGEFEAQGNLSKEGVFFNSTVVVTFLVSWKMGGATWWRQLPSGFSSGLYQLWQE